MGRNSPFRDEAGKVRNRRISPIVAHSGDRLLSEPIAGTQPCRRQPLFLLRVFGCLPDTGVSERTEAGVRKASGEESAGELSLAVVSGYGDLAPEFDLIGGL